jgi:murein DD-endopeptidase MepM/ murein hydrolase activator NlpD
MRRLALALTLAFAALAAAGGQAAAQRALPSHETPNAAGSIVIPFSLSSPPARPEQRSYQQLLELWRAAGSAYGVPWEVLGAINKIESNFGRNMGPSSAGAVGWMQFMPSTWMRWGVDADGDGVANPWDPEDAIYAAARYLAAAGAQEDLSRAIFAYNHADWYVRDVLELAQVFAGGGGFDPSLTASPTEASFTVPAGGADAVFRLDAMEERLAKARRAVNRAQREVAAAEDKVERLEAVVLAAEQRAGDPNLSDAEFQRLEERVTSIVLEREDATAALARKQGELEDAVRYVEDLRVSAQAEANTMTFSRSLTSELGTPQFSGSYVFPVGGGASVVSVAATHHDYPAADIVAPEGSPLFALTDAVVTATYPSPTGRCGIGFQIEVADGRTYVYCHLSYLEPTVVEGATLSAGAPVGLVGSTGNSTGPHLHLQLVPATAYPQNEAWFQSFAGTAFRWEGAPPAPAAPPMSSGPTLGFSE